MDDLIIDDLISKQDVLNLCDMRDKYKIPYEYDDGSKHIKGYDEGRIINVTKLKMLPSVKPQEPKWIPVSERLPEEGGRYLVYTWSHEIETAQYVDGYWNIKTPISAWMPLPEPYKVEPQESEG